MHNIIRGARKSDFYEAQKDILARQEVANKRYLACVWVKRSREVVMVQRHVCTELEVSGRNYRSYKRSVTVVSDYAESGPFVMLMKK